MAQTSEENFARRSATSLKRTNSTPGITGAKGSRYFSLCGGGDRAHGAAVKAVLEREELRADVSCLRAEEAGVGAGQLQRGLPGFGAAVGEEDAVHAADLGEAQGEFGGVLVEEEVRGVDEALRLCSVIASSIGGCP